MSAGVTMQIPLQAAEYPMGNRGADRRAKPEIRNRHVVGVLGQAAHFFIGVQAGNALADRAEGGGFFEDGHVGNHAHLQCAL
jgi:hypothetical protein